jgi:hypothetical protein
MTVDPWDTRADSAADDAAALLEHAAVVQTRSLALLSQSKALRLGVTRLSALSRVHLADMHAIACNATAAASVVTDTGELRLHKPRVTLIKSR